MNQELSDVDVNNADDLAEKDPYPKATIFDLYMSVSQQLSTQTLTTIVFSGIYTPLYIYGILYLAISSAAAWMSG